MYWNVSSAYYYSYVLFGVCIIFYFSICLLTGMEWITYISKSPQKGHLKTIKPYIQHVDKFLERILGGNKFTITSTNILLMGIIVLLLTLIMTKSQETVVKIKNKEEKKD